MLPYACCQGYHFLDQTTLDNQYCLKYFPSIGFVHHSMKNFGYPCKNDLFHAKEGVVQNRRDIYLLFIHIACDRDGDIMHFWLRY